jgi:hypothetical protein
MPTARANTGFRLRDGGARDVFAASGSLLEVGAFAGLDRPELDGVVAATVLGGHLPRTPLPDERLRVLPEQPLTAQYAGVVLYFVVGLVPGTG